MHCTPCNDRIIDILIVCVAIAIAIALAMAMAMAMAKFKSYLVNQLRIEILFRDCNNNTNDCDQELQQTLGHDQ